MNRRYQMNPESIQNLDAGLLYISTSKYEEDWPSLPHMHPFTELFYVVNGQGTFYLDGKSFPISANDLVIVMPNIEHTEQSLETNPLEYIVLGIDGISFLDVDYSISRFRYNYQDQKGLQTIIHLLLEEVHKEQYGYELVCHNLLEMLLIHIIRYQKLVPTSVNTVAATKECSLIKRYIDAHYSEELSLEFLASYSHMNKFYLVHAFTRITGQSPIQYLLRKRLDVSCELLKNTNHSISEVAASVGFSSHSYFTQSFKKSMGLSPREYRRKHLEQHNAERN